MAKKYRLILINKDVPIDYPNGEMKWEIRKVYVIQELSKNGWEWREKRVFDDYEKAVQYFDKTVEEAMLLAIKPEIIKEVTIEDND